MKTENIEKMVIKVAEKEKTGIQYRDTLVRKLFKDEARAIELCNAVTGSNYGKDVKVQLCDLDSSLLLRYNDLAYAIDGQLLFMVEHQSAISPNLPIRFLSYITDVLYMWFVETDKLYGSTLRKIPAPKCYVLYNGIDPLKEKTLKLSDAFYINDGKTSLELEVTVIDVNYCEKNEILAKSESLKGYSYLIDQIRLNQTKNHSRDKAISMAIELCIEEGILSEFLKENYLEVAKMLNLQYDQEAEYKIIHQEGVEEGIELGVERGIEQGEHKKAIDMAKIGFKNNIPIETIAVMTGFSISELEEIRTAGLLE